MTEAEAVAMAEKAQKADVSAEAGAEAEELVVQMGCGLWVWRAGGGVCGKCTASV